LARAARLRIDYSARSRSWILFSGTAGQVCDTFQTELHRFRVGGREHFANIAEARIPADLEPLVFTLKGLDDFGAAPRQRAKPMVPEWRPAWLS
jgi:hypothetical protein